MQLRSRFFLLGRAEIRHSGHAAQRSGLFDQCNEPWIVTSTSNWRISLVAIDFFATLVPLLRFQRHRGDRPGVETLQADRIARLFAVTVSALVDALQRGVDRGDKLALPVARPELAGAIGLRGGPVGNNGKL